VAALLRPLAMNSPTLSNAVSHIPPQQPVAYVCGSTVVVMTSSNRSGRSNMLR
jgi:hypothetical protein